MEFKELKIKSEDELKKLLKELRETLRDLKFRVHRGDEKKVHQVSENKTTIARILTLLKRF